MNHADTSVMETIGLLEELARGLREDECGYRAAADVVERDEIAGMLGELAERRALFVQELLATVEDLGGEPADLALDREAEGRGWLEHEPVSGGSDEEILKACARGAEETAAAFREGLAADHLPDDVADTIEDRLAELEAAVERVRGFARVVERESEGE